MRDCKCPTCEVTGPLIEQEIKNVAYIQKLESSLAEAKAQLESELSAARKCVQAGKELIARAELMCGYKHNLGDPPAIIQLKDLELAIKAYDRTMGGEGE